MSIGRHAALLTATTVAGQLMQLLTLPLVSRYAPPEAFGTYTVFIGFCAIATVFAGLRYDSAIVVARSDRQGRLASTLVTWLGLATALAVGLAAVLLRPWLPGVGGESTWTMTGLAMIYLMANTVVRVNSAWLNRVTRFGWVGGIQFLTVAGMVAVQIPLLVAGVRPALALCAGYAGGQVVAALAGQIGPGRQSYPRTRSGRKALFATARHFVAFPRYMILYGLSTAVRERAIQGMVAWGAGAAALGQFAMAQRLEGAPHAFLHGGLGPSLLSHARRSERAHVAQVAAQLIELATLVLGPVFVFLIVNADPLVHAFFQPRWADTAVYIRLLAPAFLTLACTAFLDRMFELYGQQRVALHIDVTYTVAVLAALALAGLSGSGVVMATAFTVVFCIYELAWTYFAFASNGLGTAGLKRLAITCGLYLLALLAIDVALLAIDSLWLRLLAAAATFALFLAGHWRWLGGRRLLTQLIRS